MDSHQEEKIKRMNADQRRPAKSYTDGRDEMNLSEFPISVLQRQQPLDGSGTKLDRVSFESSRYDTLRRQRVQQRVVLETSSRHGLPTPADENVILALLFVAKHAHDFSESVVFFTPRQLFGIMGWAPNSRSYDRLREVFRRLKALVIRYENSWWDAEDRGFEAEFATGIISEYELARQVAGRKKGAAKPANWVRWSPHFQQSLTGGNLKKLDLELLFSLRLPTSQRMYRFLDKRFYPRHQPPVVEMDLVDFACGHIGLSKVHNVAELKRRLKPAITELEDIGFIESSDPKSRFEKVRPGIWRVRFSAGRMYGPEKAGLPKESAPKSLPAMERRAPPASICQTSSPEERELPQAFYRSWNGAEAAHIGPSDILHARDLIAAHGHEAAKGVVSSLVHVVKRRWPDCKSFSGAVKKYLAEAVANNHHVQIRQVGRERSELAQVRERTEAQEHLVERQQLEKRWQALTDEHRAAIERDVLREFPELRDRPGILKGFCQNKLR